MWRLVLPGSSRSCSASNCALPESAQEPREGGSEGEGTGARFPLMEWAVKTLDEPPDIRRDDVAEGMAAVV